MNTLIQTNLSSFSVGDYYSAPKWKIISWYLFSYFLFDTGVPWPYTFKAFILRCYGAKIGQGIVLKTHIKIKNPWMLTIGDHCWLGESVWIDNLIDVKIGNNVCLSQGAMLLTGNHDYTQSDFPYRLGKIELQDGVWIGAQAVVCPGVTCNSHAILTVNSVATKNLDEWRIYSGNPAAAVRFRKITA